MGRTAAVAKARAQDARQRQQRRARRGAAVRAQRRGEARAERLVQHVAVTRPVPSRAQRELLLAQFTQACRLPLPALDLCALLRRCASDAATDSVPPTEPRKRPRAQTDDDDACAALLRKMTDALVAAETAPAGDLDADDDDDNDDEALLLAILQDEHGVRVVRALLHALHATGADVDAVATVLLAQFEENELLPSHHAACRVLSAMVQYAGSAVQDKVLQLLQTGCTTATALRATLTDRHHAGTLLHLLQHRPEPTAAWLTTMLTLDDDNDVLRELVQDPVASAVLQRWVLVDHAVRPTLLQKLDPVVLLQSRRGTRLLTDLLASPNTNEKAAADATLTAMTHTLGTRLPELSVDRQGNFVVQQLLRLAAHTTPASNWITKLYTALRPAVADLARHPIGVHVVLTLIDVALQQRPRSAAVVDELGASLVRSDTVADLLRDPHGSLVLRHLMPLVADSDNRTAALLRHAVDADALGLAFDAVGNLVLQRYWEVRGKTSATSFARTALREGELLRMATHPAASHALVALLDAVTPATHTAMAAALIPHALELATHVNGRYVVEKLLGGSRALRDRLVHAFATLAQHKGTQHVYCSLLAHLDERGTQTLIMDALLPHLATLACAQHGSVTVQKMMQASAPVLHAVRTALDADHDLRNTLAQNFYGKYVVLIADNTNP